jgi:hypothetical protein
LKLVLTALNAFEKVQEWRGENLRYFELAVLSEAGQGRGTLSLKIPGLEG